MVAGPKLIVTEIMRGGQSGEILDMFERDLTVLQALGVGERNLRWFQSNTETGTVIYSAGSRVEGTYLQGGDYSRISMWTYVKVEMPVRHQAEEWIPGTPPQVAFMVEKQGSVATWGRGCCYTKQTETSEFGAEKGSSIEEAPTQRQEA